MGRLLLPVYLGNRRFPLTAILTGYFDDSFLEGGGAYVIAGYLGYVGLWDEVFEPAWRAELDAAAHPISEFKSCDCRHRNGEFKGWKKGETVELTKRLVSVITDKLPSEKVLGYSCAMVFPGYAEKEHHARVYGTAYALCLLQVMGSVVDIGRKVLDAGDEIRFIFDDKPGFRGKTHSYFEEVKRIAQQRFDVSMEFPIFADSKKVLPLQAADLLAYETMKEAKSRIEGGKRPVSKALRALVDGQSHIAECLTWHQAIELERRKLSGGGPMDVGPLGEHLWPGTLFETGAEWRSKGQWPYY